MKSVNEKGFTIVPGDDNDDDGHNDDDNNNNVFVRKHVEHYFIIGF